MKFATVFLFVKSLQNQFVNFTKVFGSQLDEVVRLPKMGGFLSHNFKAPLVRDKIWLRRMGRLGFPKKFSVFVRVFLANVSVLSRPYPVSQSPLSFILGAGAYFAVRCGSGKNGGCAGMFGVRGASYIAVFIGACGYSFSAGCCAPN